MRGDCGRAPNGREPLDQVARRDDLDAGLPHELDRSGIHARYIRNRAAGRIFHGDAVDAGQQAAQTGLQLIAARVALGCARQMRQRVLFDRVHETARFTGCRNQIVPAPRGEMTALAIHGGDVRRDRIDAAKIV